MSEITNHQEKRIEELICVFNAITYKKNAIEVINLYKTTVENATPDDVVLLVHQLVENNMPMQEVKIGVSRILNVLHKSLENFQDVTPKAGSFFDICIKNNKKVIEKLNVMRPFIIQINKEKTDKKTNSKQINAWKEIEKFTNYYAIKENTLFPLIEKYIPQYKCITIMWSIHDETRKNVKEIIKMLSVDVFDIKQYNKIVGEVFYNIYTIKFREEKLLYPFLLKSIPNDEIEKLWNESVEIGFPYFNPAQRPEKKSENLCSTDELNLKSGSLTLKQIILIFNHLPVDITFVDEHDKVRFFSTPQKRIFTRTNAIIGRDVRNCHPHESVHVVEKIVESFRNGSKNQAEFWINMNRNKILIQYFAVRDESENYKGVIEVTQEISEIQSLQGERKILDWEN